MTQIVKLLFLMISQNYIIYKYMNEIDKKLDTMYNKIYKLNKLSYISISDDYIRYYENYHIIDDFDLKKTLIFDNVINKILKEILILFLIVHVISVILIL